MQPWWASTKVSEKTASSALLVQLLWTREVISFAFESHGPSGGDK